MINGKRLKELRKAKGLNQEELDFMNLEDALKYINEVINERKTSKSFLHNGMGTTVVAAIIADNENELDYELLYGKQ